MTIPACITKVKKAQIVINKTNLFSKKCDIDMTVFMLNQSRIFAIISILLLFPMQLYAAGASNSGLPVPRFVSLKSDEVNIRTGPGTRYPISWVYRRAEMPVEVVEEFDMWRKIRDVEGTTGWVHKTMLAGKRNIIIKGKSAKIVRIDHEKDAKPLLKVEPSVVARLVECNKEWCRILVSGRKGWIEKNSIWGVYPDEIME